MKAEMLFAEALGIQAPWKIESIEFDSEKKHLDIHVDFVRGSVFSYQDPETGEEESYKAYDTVEKTWRHLNFFEHVCYIHARVPRIQPKDGGTKMVSPPWSGRVNGFTLLFEALILQICTNMPIMKASRILKTTDHKLWAVLEGYTEAALKDEDYSEVRTIGIDETSIRKGHNYITLFVDLVSKRTLFVTEGRDHQTVARFAQALESRNGNRNNIKDVSCDMSPAFIKGVREALPHAEITFDKFHILKVINEAVDAVRKEEVKTQPVLKGNRYVFLKNDYNLTAKQMKAKTALSKLNLKTVRALRMRVSFQEIYQATTVDDFKSFLQRWYYWMTHSKLKPMIKAAKTIKKHWSGVIRWKSSQINNGILEGLNSVIQAAKRKARGYKFKHFKVMVHLLTSKLDFSKLNPYLPTCF